MDHRSTEIHVTPRGEESLNRLTVANRREMLELSAEIREMLVELEDIVRESGVSVTGIYRCSAGTRRLPWISRIHHIRAVKTTRDLD